MSNTGVELDQIVLTVETAKAVVDVPAPTWCCVSRYGEAGDIGAPLMEIEEQAELVGS